MKIIAFLGNPGKKYSRNRHNAGFIIGELLAAEFNISCRKKQFSSVTGTGKINGEEILLMFPETYMNNSGMPVQKALLYYSETAENLLVVHDEIELPFGEIKSKYDGGHKGHNGIRSIMQQINSSAFTRIRIGVGRPEHPEIKVADFLLSNFTKEELNTLKERSPEIIDLIVSKI